MNERARWQIVRIAKGHIRKELDSGNAELDEYLRRFARKNDTAGITTTYVAVTPEDAHVVGYYTVRAGQVAWDMLPAQKERRRLPRYPVPVFHLARLAVDRSVQGLGLGETLLMHALEKALKLSDELGLYAVEVLAVDERARDFYLKYGFSPLVDDKLHLYLSLKVVEKVFASR